MVVYTRQGQEGEERIGDSERELCMARERCETVLGKKGLGAAEDTVKEILGSLVFFNTRGEIHKKEVGRVREKCVEREKAVEHFEEGNAEELLRILLMNHEA